ncbi:MULTISPECIES: ice-binding family protein [Bacteria]
MVQKFIHRGAVLLASVAVIGVAILPTAAYADTTIDGPIGLGTAEPFAVLAGSTVTISPDGTPPESVINGDIGVSPGLAVTGYENVQLPRVGVVVPLSVADQAQADLTIAYGVAASLTPAPQSAGDLTDLSLVPGVYRGFPLSLTGNLTLDGGGNVDSVWVFQSTSSLVIAGTAEVTLTGGANACNVFWQVGSSATINGGADFVGTVMAQESISVGANATVAGRLLAQDAVTLISDTITRPSGCSATGGTVTTTPTITSAGPTAGTAGTEYSYTVTASGTPTPTYSITGGTLPTGLGLDATSGTISGTPTTPGTYTFTVTASNGTSADASATYTVVIAAPTVAVAAGEQLAESGSDPTLPIVLGGALLAAGAAFFFIARGARIARRR